MSAERAQRDVCGGLSALLVAWHPIAVDEVRIARCYGLVLLMSALVVLTAICWLKSDRPLYSVFLWAICAAGLLWTHYTSALLVMISASFMGFVCLTREDGLRQMLNWLTAMALVTIVCLPLIAPVRRLQEWGPYLNYSAAGVTFWEVIGPFWWLGFPVGLIVKFFANHVWTKNQAATSNLKTKLDPWLLAACSVLPLLILAVLSLGALSSLANPRYQIAYIPATVCLFSMLLIRKSHWKTATLAAVVLLFCTWTASPRWPWEPGRIGSVTSYEWLELNTIVAEESMIEEPIFVQSGLMESNLVPVFAQDRLFMEYVACRVGRFYVESIHPRYALPFHWQPQLKTDQFYRSLLQSWSDPNASFWIASATDTDLNRQSLEGFCTVAKQSGYALVDSHVWQTATLLRYKKQGEEF